MTSIERRLINENKILKAQVEGLGRTMKNLGARVAKLEHHSKLQSDLPTIFKQMDRENKRTKRSLEAIARQVKA